jgi:small nuclear ribonucleoprotein D1
MNSLGPTHVFCSSRGKSPKSYSTLSVRGSTMRAWLLPESLNLDALLVDTDIEIHSKAILPQSQPQRAAKNSGGRGGGGGGRGRGRR